MKLRMLSIALVVALVSMVVFAPVSTTKAQGSPLTVPVTGTLANGGAFNGLFTVTQFVNQNGQLAAVGTLTGTLTDALGNVLGSVSQALTLLVNTAQGTCQVLNLDLGPLDLSLLGLNVHLNEVVLNITAQSGPGNLLGNLLCAVAHLLDNNGPVNGLVGLLNNILRAL